jgi:flavodoxin
MGKSIIFLYSYHHGNTRKICDAIASKIDAAIFDIKSNIEPTELDAYDLVGFGSGIDSGKHYPQMIEFVEKLPSVQNKKAFIFSTSGIYTYKKMLNDHKILKKILENKGFTIINEFSCKGYNTNSILKYFGGMNRDRPNEEDIKDAEIFGEKLLK